MLLDDVTAEVLDARARQLQALAQPRFWRILRSVPGENDRGLAQRWPPSPPCDMPRIIIHIIAVHMIAATMKLAPATPVATRTIAITNIGMQQAIIIQWL